MGGWDERLIHHGSYKSLIHLYDLHLTCSSVSLPIAIQLQLHANKQSILQRRKGGDANWSDCNSVHQVQSESIMLRNGFWESECPPWVRGVCLQQCRPAFVCQRVCVLQQVVKNHNNLCFISDKSSCKIQHGVIQKMSRSFVIGGIGWLVWFFYSLLICFFVFLLRNMAEQTNWCAFYLYYQNHRLPAVFVCIIYTCFIQHMCAVHVKHSLTLVLLARHTYPNQFQTIYRWLYRHAEYWHITV